ncbi:MAG: site-specific integrase [Bacteroidetes bacterium]|nr:site-specific integrase [Bacteroidota bacterium]
MKNMKPAATTAIILDTRYKKKNEKHPVKLRVTHKRKQKYFVTEFDLTQEDFDKVFSPKPRGELKQIKLKLEAIEAKANEIIQSLQFFSLEQFEKYLKIQFSSAGLVKEVYNQYIRKLEAEGRYSYAQTFVCSKNSIFEFCNNENVEFIDITEHFLKAYEKWMIKCGKSISTVGIYLRPLRVIFNYAHKEGVINNKIYPFGKSKYNIPSSRNKKRAISIDDIEKIFNYQTIPFSSEDKAKDLWIFSYLCNGINVKDMALLKYKNITNQAIVYIRSKTANSRKKDLEPIEAALTDDLRSIIEKWGNKPILKDKYVFPILREGLSDKQIYERIHQSTKSINKYMKEIGDKLNIPVKLTTYVARHTYSTVMMQSGMTAEFIKEQLGHSSTQTTEKYLGSFGFDVKKKSSNHLTKFRKKT